MVDGIAVVGILRAGRAPSRKGRRIMLGTEPYDPLQLEHRFLSFPNHAVAVAAIAIVTCPSFFPLCSANWFFSPPILPLIRMTPPTFLKQIKLTVPLKIHSFVVRPPFLNIYIYIYTHIFFSCHDGQATPGDARAAPLEPLPPTRSVKDGMQGRPRQPATPPVRTNKKNTPMIPLEECTSTRHTV